MSTPVRPKNRDEKSWSPSLYRKGSSPSTCRVLRATWIMIRRPSFLPNRTMPFPWVRARRLPIGPWYATLMTWWTWMRVRTSSTWVSRCLGRMWTRAVRRSHDPQSAWSIAKPTNPKTWSWTDKCRCRANLFWCHERSSPWSCHPRFNSGFTRDFCPWLARSRTTSPMKLQPKDSRHRRFPNRLWCSILWTPSPRSPCETVHTRIIFKYDSAWYSVTCP